jgi:hypothetical protein
MAMRVAGEWRQRQQRGWFLWQQRRQAMTMVTAMVARAMATATRVQGEGQQEGDGGGNDCGSNANAIAWLEHDPSVNWIAESYLKMKVK